MTDERRRELCTTDSVRLLRLHEAQKSLAIALGLTHPDVTVEELTDRIKRLRALLYTHGIDDAIRELQALREAVRHAT